MTIAAYCGLRVCARKVLDLVLAVSASVALVACGGGGGGSDVPPTTPDTPLIYGTAAQGAAMDGTVSVEDSAGRIVSTPISGTSGEFSVSATGLVAPFMLKATSGDGKTVLYSAAAVAGRVNVTPMTHVSLMRLAAQNNLKGPATLYASPSLFKAALTGSALHDASAVAIGRLMPAFVSGLPGSKPDSAPSYDPYATRLTVGDAVDHLMDLYPIRISSSAEGVELATQTDVAAGVAAVVSRSDTAAASGKQLAILGSTADVAAGSATQLTAQATFSNNVVQVVPVTWTLLGTGQIDANGKFVAPAVTAATKIPVRAQWFDGTQTLTSETTLNVVPVFRPVSLEITGADTGIVAANGDVALTAKVHWSDGTITTPSATWTWSGDASAVRQLGADGHLFAGAPAVDQPIEVRGSFTSEGVTVASTQDITVTKFVRVVTSLEINGFTGGTTLLAGATADLIAIAHWNDGTQSTVSPEWSVHQTSGVQDRIAVAISQTGYLSSAAFYLPPDADQAARAPDQFLVTASYGGNSDGPVTTSTALAVKPLIKEPAALVIRGAIELTEGATTSYQAFITYSDGSQDETTATWVSADSTMLQSVGAASFRAGEYAQKPAQSQQVKITATLNYTYRDADDRPVTKALEASLDVAIAWVEPMLSSITLPSDFDFVEPGPTGTTVKVTGRYSKLGREFDQEVRDATLTSNNQRLAGNGNVLTIVTAPTSASESWATVTAAARDAASGGDVTASRLVTIGRAAAVSKRLLAYPWGPYGSSTQFRAISSAGHLLDYNVVRDDSRRTGFNSAATARQVPFLTGLTDLSQSQTVGNETQYVAAVSFGELLVIRLQDLYDPARAVTPIVQPTSGRATAAALVYRASANSQPAAVLLYVRTEDGSVHRLAMPAQLDRALKASDILHEAKLPGVFQAISAGAEHLVLTKANGAIFGEGSNSKGQVGDPAPDQTGWHDLFQTQSVQFDVAGSPTYSNFVGPTPVFAERDASMATDATNLRGWGAVDSTSYILRGISDTAAATASAATNLISSVGAARSLTGGAFVQADGSVIFRSADFVGSSYEDRDLWGSGLRNYGVAAWLPSALQVVACHRQIAEWPFTGGELAKLMPIVRTGTDALVYLDGRPIVDAAGQAVIIP